MLVSFAADFRRTPIPILEQLERRTGEISAALAAQNGARGSVVLATCNRFEAYLDLAEVPPHRVLGQIASASRIDLETLTAGVGISVGEAAAEHLFSVASGLESAAVGEGEIAGQVRRAHSRAREQGSVSDLLERLFQGAHRVSRDVKRRTELQGEGRSLVRLALLLAEGRITSWQDARVLLVGTGAYAGATVAALRERGAERVLVHSPSGRAAAFAEARGLGAVPHGGLSAALASADLIVACSSVQDPVISAAELGDVPEGRRLILDLGMPRNVDPAVAEIAGTELLDIDTLAKHLPVPELSAAAEAGRLVRDAAREFSRTLGEREALSTLVSLREHVLGILEEELCRARVAGPAQSRAGEVGAGQHLATGQRPASAAETRAGKDPGSAADPAVAASIERALRRFTGKLLHEPSARIRALGREGRAHEARAAAEALFGLDRV